MHARARPDAASRARVAQVEARPTQMCLRAGPQSQGGPVPALEHNACRYDRHALSSPVVSGNVSPRGCSWMIGSLRDRETERLFRRETGPEAPSGSAASRTAQAGLLDAAESIEDLRVPPGNRLEKLTGDRAGQHSIRVNDHCRVCFRWRTVMRRMSRSSTITKASVRGRGRKLSVVSPGEILQEEFLRPLGISQYRLAKALTVPPRRINEIVHGKRAVTADTGAAVGAPFRHFGALLAEPSGPLRSRDREGPARRPTAP